MVHVLCNYCTMFCALAISLSSIMYHTKNDRRVRKSADALSDALMECLKMSVAGIIVSLLYVWDKQGRKETAEDLYETFFLFSQRLG